MSGQWLKCKVKAAIFPNCHNLLQSDVLDYLCSLIGVLIVILNLISILTHINSFHNLLPYDLFTFSLSFIESLFGIYLIIISAANWYFKGYYIGVENTWINSLTCQISSLLALISLSVSPLIIFCITLARFYIIQWPMTSKFKNKVFTSRLILIIIIITITTCVLLVTSFYGILYEHVSSGVCLMLYTGINCSHFIKFVSLVMVCLQILCFPIWFYIFLQGGH